MVEKERFSQVNYYTLAFHFSLNRFQFSIIDSLSKQPTKPEQNQITDNPNWLISFFLAYPYQLSHTCTYTDGIYTVLSRAQREEHNNLRLCLTRDPDSVFSTCSDAGKMHEQRLSLKLPVKVIRDVYSGLVSRKCVSDLKIAYRSMRGIFSDGNMAWTWRY